MARAAPEDAAVSSAKRTRRRSRPSAPTHSGIYVVNIRSTGAVQHYLFNVSVTITDNARVMGLVGKLGLAGKTPGAVLRGNLLTVALDERHELYEIAYRLGLVGACPAANRWNVTALGADADVGRPLMTIIFQDTPTGVPV